MPTLSITLSKSLSDFVAEQVGNGKSKTKEKFVTEVLEQERDRRFKDWLAKELLKGIRSKSKEVTEETWKDIERRGLERLAARKRKRSRNAKAS
jgi:hypothetical protein